MRRVMLLSLLAIGLPTAALATGIDFVTGNFVSGTFSGSLTTSVSASVAGSLNTISMTTSTLTAVGGGLYTFSGGSVTVSSGGTTLFTDALSGPGFVTADSGIEIRSGLAPFIFQGMTITRGFAILDVALTGNTVTGGTGGVALTTPESGTLGMLGTGLIGLAGMARRKLKL